jgi:hypothetical protein
MIAVTNRHLFALHPNANTVAAYPMDQLTTLSPPLWQTDPDPVRDARPSAIVVCRGDWLIIGFAEFDSAQSLAAVDVQGPPSEWKVSAQTALSAFGRPESDWLEGIAGSTDGMVSAAVYDVEFRCRVLLLNTTVAVDPLTGGRALTFSLRSVITGIERAGDIVNRRILMAWGPPLRPGEPAALYTADYDGEPGRLSVFVDGGCRWTSGEHRSVTALIAARGKVIGSKWLNSGASFFVLDAITGHRSHSVPRSLNSEVYGAIRSLAVVDDELIFCDDHESLRVLLLDDVLAVPSNSRGRRLDAAK